MCKKIMASGIKTLHLYTLNMEKSALAILMVGSYILLKILKYIPVKIHLYFLSKQFLYLKLCFTVWTHLDRILDSLKKPKFQGHYHGDALQMFFVLKKMFDQYFGRQFHQVSWTKLILPRFTCTALRKFFAKSLEASDLVRTMMVGPIVQKAIFRGQ